MADVLHTILIYPLELVFEIIFILANRAFDNPIISIVVLSLTVNLLVLPLYNRADEMQKQQRDAENSLKDGVDRIKSAFSGDERMMMLQAYYRENHYSPLYVIKDSVPLLLQIPFFIAAYRFLSGLALLQGTSLGPIADLGSPDRLFEVAGFGINVLPILMTVINLVSGWIYSRGIPLKSKLQMYLLALVFLVLLYDSPSGLVFYWTLNNVFSLGKNIVNSIKDKVSPAKKKKTIDLHYSSKDGALFFLSGLFLTSLTGLLIPSDVIKSSTADFINYMTLHTPNMFVVRTALIAFGCFVIWGGIFFAIANTNGKVILSRIWNTASFIGLITYLFFGSGHGLLTRTLEFEKPFINTVSNTLINLAVCIFVGTLIVFLARRFKSIVQISVIIIFAVCTGVSIYNIKSIEDVYRHTAERLDFDVPEFVLSTGGRNVMVIMLDRACGFLVPSIFNEFPELQEQYDGFTYYPNTISYGSYTKTGTPALFGGYDYTPQNIVADTTRTLRQTQNEALTVMPLIFRDNGFDVTVCDPPYLEYQMVPDISFFDQEQFEGIDAYVTSDNPHFDSLDYYGLRDDHLNRNFFCYSLMKVCPLLFQSLLYDYGNYNAANFVTGSYGEYTIPQVQTDVYHSEGVIQESMNSYNILDSLSDMTSVTDDDTDTFMYMANLLPHSPMYLQEPEYVPSQIVDNTQYETEHSDRYFTPDGFTFDLNSMSFMSHYQSNTAAYLLLGRYFDYLRECGVWDNTRIIIVSDHATHLIYEDTTVPNCDDGFENHVDAYNPVLMVKDFGSTGFTVNNDIITNADVPYFAVNGIVEDPVNPYTGNPIMSYEEFGADIITYDSWDVNVITSSGASGDDYRYISGSWFMFSGSDVLDRSNWLMIAYG